MKIKIYHLFLSLLLFSFSNWGSVAVGSTSQDASHGGIPKVVLWQTINFAGLVLLLYLALRKVVTTHFSKKHEDYVEAVGKAQKAKQEAEAEHHEVARKLEKLSNEANTITQRARQEAENFKKQISEEAKTQVARLRADADRQIEIEKERSVQLLKNELATRALQQARHSLATNLSKADQAELQKEFQQKIQAVR